MRVRYHRGMALLLLLSCDPGSSSSKDDSPGAVTDSERADSPGGTGNPDSTGDSRDSEKEDSPVDTTPPPQVVRFVALGDAGEGNAEQYAVGLAVAEVCAQVGCDFALYLGDNFYDTGVDGVDDSQWQEKFELPYAPLNIPFYPVLGNHDYGGEGIGWELWKGETYVEYSDHSDKWVMPDLFYTYQVEHAAFFALDSTQLFWGIVDEQGAWMDGGLAATSATWTIAYGHHPYISNGPHGNAGNYEGLSFIPIVNGESIKNFVDDHICGQVDLYLSGHDHSLQWPEDVCGTEMIVSGAGAKTTDLEGENPTWFEYDEEGFVWIELNDRTMTAVFYDASGQELFRRSVSK